MSQITLTPTGAFVSDGETLIPSDAALPRQSRLRDLALDTPAEQFWTRRVYELLALVVAAGFLYLVLSYFAPGLGMPGVDENAYLVAGRNMATHGTPALHPSTPFAFVGPMWIRTESGAYFPKYPAGVPILDAIAIRVTGDTLAACYVSPVCATLSLLAVFLLGRALAGSFAGAIATILLATNSTMLELAITPSSHAPDICFVTWGMVALLQWWRKHGMFSGIAAGFLLGCAFTIRYSEGLMLPVIGVVAAMSLYWKDWRSWLRAAVPVIAWAVPVVALLAFNRVASGHWTGYDSTHESTGFTLAEFKDKWKYTLQQLNEYGLEFILPVAALGMLMMLARTWRVGVWLLIWFVPTLLLYMSYYWGEQAGGVGYLRFFLTIYPPAIIAAMWLARTAGQSLGNSRATGILAPIVIGVFVVGCSAMDWSEAQPFLSIRHGMNLKMAMSARAFLDAVPAARHHSGKPEPILFADAMGPQFAGPTSIMYFQYVGDGEWYSADAFTLRGARGGMAGRPGRGGPGGVGRGGPPDADQSTDAPTVFDPQRAAFMQQLYSKMSSSDLAKEETKLLDKAIGEGREIYAVLTKTTADEFQRRLQREGFDCAVIARWKEFKPPPVENESTTPARGGMGMRGGQGRRGGPGGFGPPGMMGAPGGFGGGPIGMEPRATESAATFEVMKVSKSAATQPTARDQ